MNRRIRLILVLGGLLMAGICVRLVHLQLLQGAVYARAAFNEHFRLVNRQPRRGSILDREGRILAVSLASDSVYADPKIVRNPDEVSQQLSEILSIPVETFAKPLAQKNRRFCWLARNITPSQSEALHRLKLHGVFFRKESQRFYPAGPDTAGLIGITTIDGEGIEGIERTHDRSLKGTPGMELIAHDAFARPYQGSALILHDSEQGSDVQITIDLALQHFAAEALRRAVESEQASWGAAVILNPKSGDILAMASEPSYEPNTFESTSVEQRRNHCVMDLVEPGSTFKAITFAIALANRLVSPEDTIDCQGGSLWIGNAHFEDWKKFSILPVRDVLVFSSNVGTIHIAHRVGGLQLSEFARQLGFGQDVPVDIPGTQSGFIRGGPKWSQTATASLSIGYGVSTTALQMATAYGIFANGGYRISPRLVLNEPRPASERIIEENAAGTLRSLLHEVVSRGTGHLADPVYYTAGGKTGTSRRYDPARGGYQEGAITCLFAGFAPADNPQIALCIIIDNPKHGIWASQVAAPVFKEIVDRSLIYLGIPSDKGVAV